jgi:hypothetical protein
MMLVVGAEDVCTSADCEASAMVQRINRKQTAPGPLTQLLQSTTKMLREGSTPAVIVFVGDTLTEIENDIIKNILKNHEADQKFIDDQLAELQNIVTTYDEKVLELKVYETAEEKTHTNHVECRGATSRIDKTSFDEGQEPADSEAEICLKASRKNWIRAKKWAELLTGERRYTSISTNLHGRFCPPTGLTWHSKDLTDADINAMVPALETYRTTTVTHMMTFNERGDKYFRVLIPAWEEADTIATQKNASHMLKKGQCEGKKRLLETASCTRAEHHVDFIKNFEEDWTFAEDIFNKTKESIVISEKDRIREIVTLEMVKCLLEKIKIKNGTACNSTGDGDEEIKDCETRTVNTTVYEIDYECSPEKPVHPIVKVFPGQPTEYWTHRYFEIESHGFCFTDQVGVVDKVNNQFPMDAISTSCSFVTFGNDPLHTKPVFQYPYVLA